MNKEEIEELKDFTIDLTDIDELALGLEVCSKKSNMVIQEFADTIIQLQQENKQLKEELKYTVPIVEHNKIVSKKLKENQKYKEVIDKINNYIDNYDIFKVFSFPLMKRWEEEQVKSSIDYEFKTSLIKDLKDIIKEVE